MNKVTRELVSLAEAEGLKFCGIDGRSKHEFLVFENSKGLQYHMPVHRSCIAGNARYKDANKNTLRKFARGNTHGLERMIRSNANV
jgi:hypothetical protein